MLKVLLKKEMMEIFRGYFYDAKKNRARSKAATAAWFALFALLIIGLLGGIFTGMSLMLCVPLAAAGMDWLYFALMGLVAILLGVFGSVFNTYSRLYLAKDNDLLLSLPIPVHALMTSRLLGVYLMGFLYSGIVILPAVVVYWLTVSAAAGCVVGGVLFVLLISLFVLTLSCALGWVVAKISLRLKHKSFVTVAVSLLFLGGYYFITAQAQLLLRELIENAAAYGGKIKSAAYPLYLMGRIATGEPFAMLIFSAVVLALLALMWRLLSRSFLTLATSSGRAERKVYRETAARQKSPRKALLGKELGRFLSSPNYILNCGLGILFLPIAGIAFLWKGGVVFSMLDRVFGERPGTALVLLIAMACMLASMNIMVTPSISLEGKSLWLLHSLPVTPWQALNAKLSLQLLLTGVPMLFCIVCLALVGVGTPLQIFASAVQLLAFVWLSALFGLFMGLKLPNLNWTSEVTAIKQSFGVLIAMFGNFLYSMLLCAGFLFLGGWRLGFAGYMGVFGALTLVLCAVLTLWVKRKGCALFAEL